MKPKLALIVLAALGISVGCAAPPYVPAPPQNYTGVAWNPSPDASVTNYNVKAYLPTASSWTNALQTSGTNALGILSAYPSGTAFCVTAVDTNGVESLPSNQITNIVNIAPAAPGVLTVK